MGKKIAVLPMVLILVFGLSLAAQASSITQTGVQLISNSSVSFPTLSYSIAGDSIAFGTGEGNPVLVRWDLVSAGTLNAGSPDSSITITFTTTRNSTDWDISFGLWDGTSYAGIMPAYDGFAMYDITDSLSDGIHYDNNYKEAYSHSTSLEMGQRAVFTIEYILGATQTLLNFSGMGMSMQLVANDLDRTQGLSLLFTKQSSGERLLIEEVTVTSDLLDVTSVPEPSTFALLILGMLGMVGLRKKLN